MSAFKFRYKFTSDHAIIAGLVLLLFAWGPLYKRFVAPPPVPPPPAEAAPVPAAPPVPAAAPEGAVSAPASASEAGTPTEFRAPSEAGDAPPPFGRPVERIVGLAALRASHGAGIRGRTGGAQQRRDASDPLRAERRDPRGVIEPLSSGG